MSDPQIAPLLAAFSVLADERRLRIIGLIAGRAHSVEELAALLALKEPTVSHHLNRLKALDLVSMQCVGTTHLYRLNAEALRAVQKQVFALGTPAAVAIAPDAYEDKVLAAFFDGERLVSIPSGRKKRLVVLKRLIAGFEEERDHSHLLSRRAPEISQAVTTVSRVMRPASQSRAFGFRMRHNRDLVRLQPRQHFGPDAADLVEEHFLRQVRAVADQQH